MDHSTRAIRRARPRTARTATAVIAMAGLALLATACGGSPSSTGSGGSLNGEGSATSASLANFSRCMRSHGVPEFPDPGSSGNLRKIISGSQVGVSDSQLNAAQGACQHLWPYQPATQAQQEQQQLSGDLRFARCMRSHGVPNWPDPTSSDGREKFVISVSRDGFDPHSPQIMAKAQQCQHVLPAGMGLPLVSTSS